MYRTQNLNIKNKILPDILWRLDVADTIETIENFKHAKCFKYVGNFPCMGSLYGILM
jgi:hypothetical protein